MLRENRTPLEISKRAKLFKTTLPELVELVEKEDTWRLTETNRCRPGDPPHKLLVHEVPGEGVHEIYHSNSSSMKCLGKGSM